MYIKSSIKKLVRFLKSQVKSAVDEVCHDFDRDLPATIRSHPLQTHCYMSTQLQSNHIHCRPIVICQPNYKAITTTVDPQLYVNPTTKPSQTLQTHSYMSTKLQSNHKHCRPIVICQPNDKAITSTVDPYYKYDFTADPLSSIIKIQWFNTVIIIKHVIYILQQ